MLLLFSLSLGEGDESPQHRILIMFYIVEDPLI